MGWSESESSRGWNITFEFGTCPLYDKSLLVVKKYRSVIVCHPWVDLFEVEREVIKWTVLEGVGDPKSELR